MCKHLYCGEVQRIIDKAKGLGVRAPGMRGLLRFLSRPFSGGYQHVRWKRMISSQRNHGIIGGVPSTDQKAATVFAAFE